MMVAVMLAAIGYTVWEQRLATERARAELASHRSHGRRSVAVLGFKNLSGRSDTAWLSTALSEMLSTELTAGGKLRTIPGESVAQTKISLSLPEADSLSRETLGRVYKNLGSDFVVLGSFLDVGDTEGTIRLDLRVQDAGLGETIASMAETGSETSLPDLVTRAGADLRAKLGISAISPVESAAARAAFASEPAATRLFAQGVAKLEVMMHSGPAICWRKLLLPTHPLRSRTRLWPRPGPASVIRRRQLERPEKRLTLPRIWHASGISGLRGAITKPPKSGTRRSNLDYGLHLAKAEIEAGKLDESQRTIDALRKTALGGYDPRVDIADADVAQNRPDYKHELQVAIQAQKKAEAMGARLLVAQALYIQAHANGLMGDPHKSMALASEARQIFASVGDHYREAHVLLAIGNASMRADDLASAEKADIQAFETYHQIGNKADESNSLMSLGNVHLSQRDFAGAADAYHKSLALPPLAVGDIGSVAVVLTILALRRKIRDILGRCPSGFRGIASHRSAQWR